VGPLSAEAVVSLLHSYTTVATKLEQELASLAPHTGALDELEQATAKHKQARYVISTHIPFFHCILKKNYF
jgi:hypothetical protein